MENSFYVLLAVLVPLSVLVFILTEYDILSPVCIVTSLMTFSVFLATTKIERWHLYMSADASLLVISSMICFIIGGLWADWQIKQNINGIPVAKENCVYMISNRGLFLMALFILFLGYFQYREFYDTSILLGNKSGPLDFSSMIKAIRPLFERDTFSFTRWFTYRNIIARMLVTCSIFVFFVRSILYGGIGCLKQNMIYLLPLLSYILFFLCDTGRMQHLDFMLFVLFTGAIIYQIKTNFSVRGKIRIISAVICCGLIFFSLFLILGMLSGKVRTGGRPLYEILVHYGGLSIPAFSAFLEQVNIETPYIGNTTLFGIYNNLIRMGVDLPPVKLFHPFVFFNDISTNVYTMMACYINDYGYVGMHLIMWILGAFFTIFYDYVRFVSKKMDYIPYYALLPMTLFFATNDDYFFKQVINTATLYKFACLYLAFKFFVVKKEDDKVLINGSK